MLEFCRKVFQTLPTLIVACLKLFGSAVVEIRNVVLALDKGGRSGPVGWPSHTVTYVKRGQSEPSEGRPCWNSVDKFFRPSLYVL